MKKIDPKMMAISLASILGVDALAGHFLINTIKGMMATGITTSGLLSATFLSAMFIPTFVIAGLGIKLGILKHKERKERKASEKSNSIDKETPKEQKIDKDPRFQGQEHPPKIERQNMVEQSSDRSQDDTINR